MSKARGRVDGPVLLSGFLKDREMSYRTFGGKVGCTKAHVCGLINRTSLPSLDLAVKIEKFTEGAVGATSWRAEPARRARA